MRIHGFSITGCLLILAGAACAIVGWMQSRTWEYMLAKEFGEAPFWPMILFYGGILVFLAGLEMLLIYHLKITQALGQKVETFGSALFLAGPVILGIGFSELQDLKIVYFSVAVIVIGFAIQLIGKLGPEIGAPV